MEWNNVTKETSHNMTLAKNGPCGLEADCMQGGWYVNIQPNNAFRSQYDILDQHIFSWVFNEIVKYGFYKVFRETDDGWEWADLNLIIKYNFDGSEVENMSSDHPEDDLGESYYHILDSKIIKHRLNEMAATGYFYIYEHKYINKQRLKELYITLGPKIADIAEVKFDPKVSKPSKEYKKTNRTRISSNKKLKVIQRDNYTCVYCGIPANEMVDSFHIDHFIPISKGGGNEIDNLRTSCSKCNLKKNDKILETEKDLNDLTN